MARTWHTEESGREYWIDDDREWLDIALTKHRSGDYNITWTYQELAERLAFVANEMEALRQAGHDIYLPAELAESARRIVRIHSLYQSDDAVSRMPVSQAVVYLVRRDEIVTSKDLQARLAASGRAIQLNSINVALHRAVCRGDLRSPTRGQFRLPTQAEESESGKKERTHN